MDIASTLVGYGVYTVSVLHEDFPSPIANMPHKHKRDRSKNGPAYALLLIPDRLCPDCKADPDLPKI